MASQVFEENLEQIASSRYGRDMRSAIHDCIEELNRRLSAIEGGGGGGSSSINASVQDNKLILSGSGVSISNNKLVINDDNVTVSQNKLII